MLTGIHFLLTYTCNFACDHCFLYCSPEARGTFTLARIKNILDEASKLDTVNTVYFEGGEPFLYYPLMIEAIRIARDMGFDVGIVTNGYWATSVEDAELWLKPLYELGISDLSISNDSFHYGDEKDTSAKAALASATGLNLPVDTICIERPRRESEHPELEKGAPAGGGPMYRGRAAEKLTHGLPLSHWEEFTECPHENLEDPGRVHVDPFGNVHICQGLCMGNLWKTSLSELIKNYQAKNHPVCGPLVRGGPALLVKEYNVTHEDKYVDACHLCYLTRVALLDRFPEYLTPRQVYGRT